MREDPPPEVTVATVVAERQASAGARDGVKGKRNDLAARALKKLFGFRRVNSVPERTALLARANFKLACAC